MCGGRGGGGGEVFISVIAHRARVFVRSFLFFFFLGTDDLQMSKKKKSHV